MTYIRVGDYYIPDPMLDESESVKTVGKYGSLRRTYLKQYKHELAGSGKSITHLAGINAAANEWLDWMMPDMVKAAGAAEELKARDQMVWAGLINGCKARVEEIILAELVFRD